MNGVDGEVPDDHAQLLDERRSVQRSDRQTAHLGDAPAVDRDAGQRSDCHAELCECRLLCRSPVVRPPLPASTTTTTRKNTARKLDASTKDMTKLSRLSCYVM